MKILLILFFVVRPKSCRYSWLSVWTSFGHKARFGCFSRMMMSSETTGFVRWISITRCHPPQAKWKHLLRHSFQASCVTNLTAENSKTLPQRKLELTASLWIKTYWNLIAVMLLFDENTFVFTITNQKITFLPTLTRNKSFKGDKVAS